MNIRKPLIAGNWKMFKTCSEAMETAKLLVTRIADVTNVDVMIAPAFTALAQVGDIVKGSNLSLGAQNIFWEKEGAFTGEISPQMLVSTGCRYVIIGHSERRQFFGDTDEAVNKKINAAIQADLIPVFCVGESAEERESNETFSVLDKQITKGLKGFGLEELKNLIIAYEPVWAIGTGKTATDDQAQEVHHFLRTLLGKQFGNSFAETVRILYGGSVKPNNVSGLMAKPDIDGALVGGASLDAEIFSEIVHF